MKTPFTQAQRGFSLIELMVGIAVSLVLIAIASSVFVGGVRSSRVQEERSKQTETAQLVLEILGKNIRSAGTFPALNPGLPNNIDPNIKIVSTVEGFTKKGYPGNTVGLGFPAFNTGIYACADAKYDRATGQCLGAGDNPNSDTLIINYFSDDTFPQTDGSFPGPGSGTRNDCLNQSVDALPHNQVAAVNEIPVLVTNIYSLGPVQSYDGTQAAVSSRSFGCLTLGNALQQPFFRGVEQMRFRFGLFDALSGSAPRRFYTITEMNALPLLLPGNLTAWQRVVAVEVCIQTRSLENNAREGASASTFKDCDGNSVTANSANQARSIGVINREVFNVRSTAGATL
jgi:type IV pilus assembly protein PilW